MEVADDDRVEFSRVELADNPWKRSLAKVEEDRGRAMSNKIRGPGGTGSIRVRRAGPGNEQFERSLAHPGILRGRYRSALGDARPGQPFRPADPLGAWPVAVAGRGLRRGLAATLVIARGRCRRGR